MLSDYAYCLEDVLEQNFTEETTDDDKIYILVMVGRLRRILKWDPGEDENLFDKSRGPEFMGDLIALFMKWKTFACDSNNLADMIGMQHLIIYSLAKLCVYYWLKESDMVADVLRQVYLCDGHFSSMFSHIINGDDRRMVSQSSNLDLKEKERLAMLFFLSHAQRVKLMFDGVRFIDTRLRVPLRVPPAFLAAIYNKPRLLLLLLRHGASLEWSPAVGDFGECDDWDLNMVLRHQIRILWTSLGADVADWESTVITSTLSDVWECLQIELRAIRQVQMGELDFSFMNFDQSGLTMSRSSHDFIRSISERGIIPRLVYRYLEPPELQHLCRCTIREALNKNWNLPYGISALPVPKLIKSYLDLITD